MSDTRPDHDPDTAPIPRLRTGERRRAAIALVVLAVGAAAFVGILIAALGVGGSGSNAASGQSRPPGPAVTVTGGHRSASTPPTRSTSKPPSTSTSPRASVSCPTSAPCAANGDVGDLIGALNTYRTRHNRPAVVGTVTDVAKTCALSSGDKCPAGFYWEPVGRSGTQFIHKIVSTGRDNGQLLDPNLGPVQVGWAYLPQSKSFEVALIVAS